MEEVKKVAMLPGTFQRPEGMSDEVWVAFCAERGLVSMTVEEFSKIGEMAAEREFARRWEKKRAVALASRKTTKVLEGREKAKLARKARKKARR